MRIPYMYQAVQDPQPQFAFQRSPLLFLANQRAPLPLFFLFLFITIYLLLFILIFSFSFLSPPFPQPTWNRGWNRHYQRSSSLPYCHRNSLVEFHRHAYISFRFPYTRSSVCQFAKTVALIPLPSSLSSLYWKYLRGLLSCQVSERRNFTRGSTNPIA